MTSNPPRAWILRTCRGLSLILPVCGWIPVLKAEVLVDSIGSGTTNSSVDISVGFAGTMGFRTDGRRHRLDSVDLMMNVHVPALCEGRVYAANGDYSPVGPVLGILNSPASFAQDPVFEVASFVPSSPVVLEPHSNYAFVLMATTEGGAFHWQVERVENPQTINGSVAGAGFMPRKILVSPYLHLAPENADSSPTFDLTYSNNMTWSGRVNVTPAPVCETLPAWRARTLNPANAESPPPSGDLDDPDGDGVVNLLEYALDTDPLAPNPGVEPAAIVVSGMTYPAVTFRRRLCRDHLQYVVETSDDLSKWDRGVEHVVEAPPALDNSDGTEQVIFRSVIPFQAGPRRFMRLKVDYSGPE